MQLQKLAGNTGFKQVVTNLLKTGLLPHAVLLTAPDGCGRGYAARLLAADYLHPAGGAEADAVLREESPELLVVRGEGKSGQIPVDRVRAVRQKVHYSSLSAGGRVVWICDAHMMAAPAANALLKVLEEPPPGVLFILTTRDASQLPLTIASRCALYALSPVSVQECEDALRQHMPPEADDDLPALLSAVYGGGIGLGLRVLREEGRLRILRDALAAAEAAGQGNRYSLLRFFSAYESRADGEKENRDMFLSDFAAVLEASLRGTSLRGVPALAPALAAHLLVPLQQARTALRGNAAPKITLTALAVQLGNQQKIQARKLSI